MDYKNIRTGRRINKHNEPIRQTQIKDYYDQGKTWFEIKNLTGCSNYSISKVLKSYKITKSELKGGSNIKKSLKKSSNDITKDYLPLAENCDNNEYVIITNSWLKSTSEKINSLGKKYKL